MDLGFTTGRFFLDDFIVTTSELNNLNKLNNADFTNGSSGWNFITLGGAQATGVVENGEYAISINNGGNNAWDVHLGQEELLIENGKNYDVSFDAYVSSPRDIYAIVGKNSDPWTVYCGVQRISLTTTKNRYSYSFKMNDPTDNQARLGFDVGASSGDVFFDNIRFNERSTPIEVKPGKFNRLESFELRQNYPNPFNAETTIFYELAKHARISLKIYNTQGQEIKTLTDKVQGAGKYSITWDGNSNWGRAVSSGIYLLEMRSEGFSRLIKMSLLR